MLDIIDGVAAATGVERAVRVSCVAHFGCRLAGVSIIKVWTALVLTWNVVVSIVVVWIAVGLTLSESLVE